MAISHHVDFSKASNFIYWRGREDGGTSPCQIFSKLVYPKQRYCDFSNIQNGRHRHLGFMKLLESASFEPLSVKIWWAVWSVGELLEKGHKKWLYFTYLPRCPPWTHFHQVLYSCRSRGRNHLWSTNFLAIGYGSSILWGSKNEGFPLTKFPQQV